MTLPELREPWDWMVPYVSDHLTTTGEVQRVPCNWEGLGALQEKEECATTESGLQGAARCWVCWLFLRYRSRCRDRSTRGGASARSLSLIVDAEPTTDTESFGSLTLANKR